MSAIRPHRCPQQCPHPSRPTFITVGADFQADRGEFEVVGWGRDEESWSLDYTIIEGDPELPDFWRRVDDYLLRSWRREDGTELKVMAACLDSGHHTEHVYQFARARLGRRIWAVKGQSARHGQRSPVWPTARPSSRRKQGFRPVILGVNAAKDVIRSRLAIEKVGPGYMHFPAERDLAYFSQLTSERLVTKHVGGTKFRVWELPRGRANEALDCRVYAYAALAGLMHFGLQLNRKAAEAERRREAPPDPEHRPALPEERPATRDPITLPQTTSPMVKVTSLQPKLTRSQRMAR